MRITSLTLSSLVCASLVAPAAAEEFHRVVAGLNYRVADGHDTPLVQAVRLRPDTRQVLVRYANARTEWVDASRLASLPQPVAMDAGSYLFAAAALACLLDRNGCLRGRAPPTPPAPHSAVLKAEPLRDAEPTGDFTRVRANQSPATAR